MDRFEELKLKYKSVLNLIEQKKLRMHNLHVQDNKLFIKDSRIHSPNSKVEGCGETHP